MPQLGDSHKKYILDPKHGKTTNIKYEATRLFIKENLKEGDNILELFGGVGITTGIILDTIKPNNHSVVEIANDSFLELQRKYGAIDNVKLYNTDAFTFNWLEHGFNFNWVLIDSTFKMSIKRNFDSMFELLKQDRSNVFFTESEIFKLLFIKQENRYEERIKHFNKLIAMFKSYNLNTKKIYYCSSNSYLVLVREPVEAPEIIEVPIGTTFWRKYL